MKEKILKSLPLFASLSSEEIRNLSSILRSKEFSKDTFVFFEGEPGRRFFIVLEGQGTEAYNELRDYNK